MPVSEGLFNQKLKEIEHTFRTSFYRRQRSIWYSRIKKWREGKFLEACNLVLERREHLWAHENLLAILNNLTQGWRPISRRKNETETDKGKS